MSQQISALISIEGKEIKPFSHLNLLQELNGHHLFELRFNFDVLETDMNIAKSKEYLSKQITISLNTLAKEKADFVFKGIITNISFSNDYSSSGNIVFKGYSPTIILENGEHNASHEECNLSKIISSTLKGVPSNLLATKISPQKTIDLPFINQYRESDFAFIRRLAGEYGEWFYYSGSQLIFGSLADSSPIELHYPNDVSKFNMQIKVVPMNFEQVSYLSKDNKIVKKESKSLQVAGLENLSKFAYDSSDQLFTNPRNSLNKRKFLDESELDDSIKIAKSNRAAELLVLTASSDNPLLTIGQQIKLSGLGKDNKGEISYGKFVITSIFHSTDELGNYKNEFEAIPAGHIVPPNPYNIKPIAEPQLAIVKDNKDPDNLGRIKVQLLWQKDGQSTPWIRVMSMHSGMRNGDKKNRGIFFTPEVDDYVVVSFTQNDPDRPFVLGSLPHGKAINTAKNENNQTKAIRTRSGSTIYFHDKENNKEQEILIETDANNYISIKVENSKGNLKIYSNKAIEVNSQETIVVKSGKSIDISSGKTINMKSEKITIEASDSIVIKATKKLEQKATEIKIDGSNSTEITGGTKAKLESANTEIIGSVNTKVKGGAKLDLEGGALANLKATIVKIN